MGFPSEMRDAWTNKRKSFLIPSPEEERILKSKHCQQEGVREGFKAASIACVVSAVPTLIGVRVIPWAKANLNYTAQALIISGGSLPVVVHPGSLPVVVTSIICIRSIEHPSRLLKWTANRSPKIYYMLILFVVLLSLSLALSELFGHAGLLASIAAYFITADKTILECARRNSLADYEKTR